MEISKADWKLFREKLPEWQEGYMAKLSKEYIEILSRDLNPSDNFWELEQRIKEDKKKPGVSLSLEKRNVLYDVVALIRDGAITEEDLANFSDELKAEVREYINRLK